MLNHWRLACPPPPPAYDEAPLIDQNEGSPNDDEEHGDEREREQRGRRELEPASDSSASDSMHGADAHGDGVQVEVGGRPITSVALLPLAPPPPDASAGLPERLVQPQPPLPPPSSVAIVGEGSATSSSRQA